MLASGEQVFKTLFLPVQTLETVIFPFVKCKISWNHTLLCQDIRLDSAESRRADIINLLFEVLDMGTNISSSRLVHFQQSCSLRVSWQNWLT